LHGSRQPAHRLGADDLDLWPKILKNFRARYPGVDVSIRTGAPTSVEMVPED
jgi:DNA-binding transcriptional LysR family regulator